MRIGQEDTYGGEELIPGKLRPERGVGWYG
jgi:hypothetical protein